MLLAPDLTVCLSSVDVAAIDVDCLRGAPLNENDATGAISAKATVNNFIIFNLSPLDLIGCFVLVRVCEMLTSIGAT